MSVSCEPNTGNLLNVIFQVIQSYLNLIEIQCPLIVALYMPAGYPAARNSSPSLSQTSIEVPLSSPPFNFAINCSIRGAKISTDSFSISSS